MEIRKVQMTGGSSYIVTLPKDWIKTLNIHKNDPIGLFQQSDGTLLISSKIDKEQTQRVKEFKVDDTTDNEFLLRKLIGAYIAGYNSIRINSKGRMPPGVRITVRNFTQTTIGQEVVEETDNSITLKDLLNPAEMPFHRTIKRMHIMSKGMYEDTLHGLRNNDIELVQDVLTRDNEIDRLHWLVARQHNIILRNINFAEKMGITPGVATTSFLISRIVERIGDHIIRIAKNVIEIIDNKLDKKIIQKIDEASHLSLDIFSKSIGSFSKRDIKEANDNIVTVKKLGKKCEVISALALEQDPTISIPIGYIVESIRRIGEYAEDISENVINYLISEEKS
ncbi:PhoU family transcriptional regulator [Thermoplasmatales archaeon SG8-52-4]|nr:MAG: PhoU family transcriptional regulator [Thermoplasmatales archaeon SG8-52-4]